MKPLILIVEDDLHIQELIQTTLEEGIDLRTTTATTGNDAIRLARELKPAVILLDLWLPNTDGLELARQLRSDPETAAIAIIAVTARNKAEGPALDAGCDDFIGKPFNLDELEEKIRKCLKSQRGENSMPAFSPQGADETQND